MLEKNIQGLVTNKKVLCYQHLVRTLRILERQPHSVVQLVDAQRRVRRRQRR
jgi:hypothetical protein